MDVRKDYYTELNLTASATPQEIKSAYRALAMRFHPDANAEASSPERFRRIQEAYDILGDPQKRQEYDLQREKEGLVAPSVLVLKLTPSHRTLLQMDEEQALYVLVEIYPRSDIEVKRLPLNLCLVIDRSTSMQGVRLQRVKDATNFIIDFLDDADVFSLVTFSDRAEVVIPSQANTNKAYAKSRVSTIRSSGGTEILQGMLTGLNEIDRWRSPDMVNHIILLTDGQTYGDEEQCIREAQSACQRKIGISTMGIGQDWNDKLLDEIARQSGGTSTYIDSAAKVTTFFRDCIHNLSAVVGRDLRLTLRLNEHVRLREAFRAAPYMEHLTVNQNTISLGQLGSEQPCVVLLSLLVTTTESGNLYAGQVELEADIPTLRRRQYQAKKDIEVEVTAQASSVSRAVPSNITSILGKLAIFKMQEKTMSELENGQVEQATQRLETMATRLLSLGENELAKAALLEAGRIARTGHLSPERRKKIRYGTRSLSTFPKEIGYD